MTAGARPGAADAGGSYLFRDLPSAPRFHLFGRSVTDMYGQGRVTLMDYFAGLCGSHDFVVFVLFPILGSHDECRTTSASVPSIQSRRFTEPSSLYSRRYWSSLMLARAEASSAAE